MFSKQFQGLITPLMAKHHDQFHRMCRQNGSCMCKSYLKESRNHNHKHNNEDANFLCLVDATNMNHLAFRLSEVGAPDGALEVHQLSNFDLKVKYVHQSVNDA
jgi:hypothetical protein